MKSRSSIDGLSGRPPMQPIARRASVRPQPHPQLVTSPPPATRTPRKARPAAPPRFKRSWIKPLLLAGVFAIIVAMAFIYQVAAELIIIIYGIVAVVRRIRARTTFILAVAALACAPLAAAAGYGGAAATFSSYAFLFLVIGTICLARELSRGSGNSA